MSAEEQHEFVVNMVVEHTYTTRVTAPSAADACVKVGNKIRARLYDGLTRVDTSITAAEARRVVVEDSTS